MRIVIQNDSHFFYLTDNLKYTRRSCNRTDLCRDEQSLSGHCSERIARARCVPVLYQESGVKEINFLPVLLQRFQELYIFIGEGLRKLAKGFPFQYISKI